MKEFLYTVMGWIGRVHDAILRLNDSHELCLSDKALHFLVIGLVGMLGIFAVYPLFKWLSRKGHILAVAWIYVFTMVLGLTLAIEIGQKVSGTGTMSFADIVSGVMGFLYMFAVYALIRSIVHVVRGKRSGRQTEE
ncbi:MAG: hypothetical protein IK149_06060 [Oscillospiraceae bacterium]|nr:hypothetical protein [Oscillospiraceae bacterium]